MKAWMNEISTIIEEYKDGTTEPLDGDESEDLAHIIKAKINLHEGNITESEYDEILN